MVMPSMPAALSASFTSSSLNGWIIASIFFIASSSRRPPSRLKYVSFLAVQSEVQPLNFLVLVPAQADERIADLENDQRADDSEPPGDRTPDYLIEPLPAIT